jgi:hypothetical protein
MAKRALAKSYASPTSARVMRVPSSGTMERSISTDLNANLAPLEGEAELVFQLLADYIPHMFSSEETKR